VVQPQPTSQGIIDVKSTMRKEQLQEHKRTKLLSHLTLSLSSYWFTSFPKATSHL